MLLEGIEAHKRGLTSALQRSLGRILSRAALHGGKRVADVRLL